MPTALAPVTDPRPANQESFICCYYENQSPRIEILRISNITGWYFEKVVFPKQRVTFEAPTEGLLELYTCEFGNAVLADRINCSALQITPQL